MINIKSGFEIDLMRKSGAIAHKAMEAARAAIKPGVSTIEIDHAVVKAIRSCGAQAAFLGMYDFPKSTNVSVNNEVIHGIPGARKLKSGDIVSVDLGAVYKGWYSDMARTFTVGEVSAEAKRLISVTEACFMAGLQKACVGFRVGDIGEAIERCAQSHGCGVVREYTGHGIGFKLHEDPQIPNYRERSRGTRLSPGMTLAIEPMITLGSGDTHELSDGWTVVTNDGMLAAHHENTVLVTQGEPELLTVPKL